MRSYALLAATCVSLCAVSMAVPLSSVTAAQRIELSMWGKLETKLISQNREPNEETQGQVRMATCTRCVRTVCCPNPLGTGNADADFKNTLRVDAGCAMGEQSEVREAREI